MTVAMDVVALAGIPGISVVGVTHGLGGVSSGPPQPVNPLLALGGAEGEEWWEREQAKRDQKFDETFGYFDVPRVSSLGVPWGLSQGVAWELDEDPYGRGQPVTLSGFTANLVARARSDEKNVAFRSVAKELYRQDQEEAQRRQKLVKVTISVAGVAYVLWRVILV
jgi:hypothetical protein